MKRLMLIVGTMVAGLFLMAAGVELKSTGGSVVGPATGPGVDTCTGNGCGIGPVGISTDGGVTVVATNVTITGTDTGIVFGNGQKLVSDSIAIYLSNTGPGDRPISCAGAGSCNLGVTGRQFNALYSNSVRLGAEGGPTFLATAPTITSACTSPTVTHGTTAAFQIDVGGTCAATTTVVLGLPAATNGWACGCYNKSNTLATCEQSADTTTSATIINYTRTTGAALAFTDGNDLVISCTGR